MTNAKDDLRYLKKKMKLRWFHSFFQEAQRHLSSSTRAVKARTYARHNNGIHLDLHGFHRNNRRARDFEYKLANLALGSLKSLTQAVTLSEKKGWDRGKVLHDAQSALLQIENLLQR